MAFKERSKGSERASVANMKGGIPNRGQSKCKTQVISKRKYSLSLVTFKRICLCFKGAEGNIYGQTKKGKR